MVGHGGQPGISTCVSIFPQEQSVEGVQRFADRRQGRALRRRLQYVDKEQFSSKCPDGHTVHSLKLRFASTRQAQAARYRIVEEHKGGVMPPFVVAYAFPSIVRSMEQPVEARTPGAAVQQARPPLRGP